MMYILKTFLNLFFWFPLNRRFHLLFFRGNIVKGACLNYDRYYMLHIFSLPEVQAEVSFSDLTFLMS